MTWEFTRGSPCKNSIGIFVVWKGMLFWGVLVWSSFLAFWLAIRLIILRGNCLYRYYLLSRSENLHAGHWQPWSEFQEVPCNHTQIFGKYTHPHIADNSIDCKFIIEHCVFYLINVLFTEAIVLSCFWVTLSRLSEINEILCTVVGFFQFILGQIYLFVLKSLDSLNKHCWFHLQSYLALLQNTFLTNDLKSLIWTRYITKFIALFEKNTTIVRHLIL